MEDEEDTVVQEMDVYLCNTENPHYQVCLLQYPLRPPWRPYDLDYTRKVKLKPNARRMEMEVPLARDKNYNPNTEPALQLENLTLSGTPVDLGTTHALAVVKEDHVVLIPIDEAYALRPSLEHLGAPRADADAKAAAAAAAAGEGSAGGKEQQKDGDKLQQEGQLQPLTVTVKKRETERQAEMRLNSYAHLEAREREEPWRCLAAHAPDSDSANAIWAMLEDVKPVEVVMDMSRGEYLDAILPGSSAEQQGKPEGSSPRARSGKAEASAAGKGGSGGFGAAAEKAGKFEPLSEELQKALAEALRQLHDTSMTLYSIEQLRTFLRELKGPAAALADHPTLHLREAVQCTEAALCIRGVFVAASSGNAVTEPLRALVLSLLSDSESLRKSDVSSAAAMGSIAFEEKVYAKVMKELCSSRGGVWTIKKEAPSK